MKKLRRTSVVIAVPVLLMFAGRRLAHGSGIDCLPGDGIKVITTDVSNTDNTQFQTTFGPGYADADVDVDVSTGDVSAEGGQGGQAGAVAFSSISTTSISKPKVRIPPLSVIPPYLPYWTHGGWGTVKAYFPNGPSGYDGVYERTFNTNDAEDMKQLKGVLRSLSYNGPLEFVGGIFNGARVVFGGPDYLHHGRGFEIANALIRQRRPEGKPLLVFIDSNVDRTLLAKAGYAYVGKVSLEGDVDRNWDQVYNAAVAESLPWDVDILLISGGMKGVTVGSSLSFPGSAGGYSQANYSLSLFGASSSGITEGKGKALVSAEAYRYWPEALVKRAIPRALYDRIHAQLTPKPQAEEAAQNGVAAQQKQVGVKVSRELFELAGFQEGQRIQNLIID